jgi:hypothetical protein
VQAWRSWLIGKRTLVPSLRPRTGKERPDQTLVRMLPWAARENRSFLLRQDLSNPSKTCSSLSSRNRYASFHSLVLCDRGPTFSSRISWAQTACSSAFLIRVKGTAGNLGTYRNS